MENKAVKFLIQWISERLMDAVLGTFVVSILLMLSMVFLPQFDTIPNLISDVEDAVQIAAALVFLFYTFGGFIVTITVHNFFTRNAGIKNRLITLLVAYSAHFMLFPIVMFYEILVNDPELGAIFLCAYVGGFINILIVNTFGTRALRRILKAKPKT